MGAAPIVAQHTAPYAAAYGYAGPLNLNTQLVAHPNGAVTPLDEPAVAAARAEHLAAKGAVYGVATPAAAPISYATAAVAPAAYSAPVAGVPALVAHPNGAVVPVDEPAVAAARAEHLLANGVYGGIHATAAPAVPYGGLVSHPNGAIVPVDEPAVAAARAEHLSLLGW